jgi:hypothetical protein
MVTIVTLSHENPLAIGKFAFYDLAVQIPDLFRQSDRAK